MCVHACVLEWMWSESHSVMSDSLWPHRPYSLWNSPIQNTGVGSLSLLQEIFPTQGSNPGLPYCRQILYQLNHKGTWRVLEWVANGQIIKTEFNKETQTFNETFDQMDLIDIFSTFISNGEEYTVFSSAHGTFSGIDCPFSRGSSWPTNRTEVFCIAGGFFTS